MNYKTCKVLNDKFKLDEKYNVLLNTEKKKIEVTDGLEKGYIYAAMYFYDEVDKEIKKLEKIVRQQLDMIILESPDMDVAIMLLELSRRVKASIGDDSLDALIKEVLGEYHKHIALALDPKEAEKLTLIKESILAETIDNLYQTIINKPETEKDGFKRVALTQAYKDKMTERQKKLISPAIKMVGFLNGIKIDSLDFKDFNVSFKVFAMAQPFTEKEEAIKISLKKLMGDNT
jgi:hypothetical protein